ncbi:uncharacterized protein LOC131093368 [Melospiza georgiana]|uniref:uncharacterized protein LOC131093368 n=1 Tax=Melospiza georgiana TaxID=44398 RepID=UPI0025ACEBB4|nr:uncharacterized protein LOC131093368 [Melospiza georgiana]
MSLECPQGIPEVSLECPQLPWSPSKPLEPQDSAVAILGELLAALPRENEMLLGSADLAAYESSSGTPQRRVIWPYISWFMALDILKDRWAKLARKATKLHNSCREVATEAASEEATATAWARELQDEAACYGAAQENMVELEQAQGSGWRRPWGIWSAWWPHVTKPRCSSRELQWRLRDTEAALEGTNETSPDVPEALVAQVAVAEQLWAANACLAKDHLLKALDDIFKFYINDDPTSPSVFGAAEKCQRATKDIPRHLRPPERCQSIPKVSPVSPPQLQVLVAMVNALDEMVATLMGPHWAKFPDSLYEDLNNFTRSLRSTLNKGGVLPPLPGLWVWCPRSSRARWQQPCHADQDTC